MNLILFQSFSLFTLKWSKHKTADVNFLSLDFLPHPAFFISLLAGTYDH